MNRLVGKGDATTTGGYVVSATSMYFDEGKPMSRHGDFATCRKCEGLFRMYGTASTWFDESVRLVKHNDSVMCPCRNNRVIAGWHNSMYTDDGLRSSAVVEGAAASGSPSSVYDQQFALTDGNGKPLDDTRYTVRMPSGELLHGVTDSEGRTASYATDAAQSPTVSLGHRHERSC